MTSGDGVATLAGMPVPDAPEPPDETTDLDAVPAFLRDRHSATPTGSTRPIVAASPTDAILDPAALPMAGIAPRRLVVIGATIILAWFVVSFGRQVAEASAASARADELRAANAALIDEVTALEQELQTIQDQRYIAQAARAFRLGSVREIPFALAADAPPLGPDAPGSASVRLGGDAASRSPVERWLDVLFGPGG